MRIAFLIGILSSILLSGCIASNAPNLVGKRGNYANTGKSFEDIRAAIHVGRILGVESYSIDEYEALTGTDAVLTYLKDIEDGFDLPGYIERRYEGMRVNYML